MKYKYRKRKMNALRDIIDRMGLKVHHVINDFNRKFPSRAYLN